MRSTLQYIDHFAILAASETKLMTTAQRRRMIELQRTPRHADLAPPLPATGESGFHVFSITDDTRRRWRVASLITVPSWWYTVLALLTAFILNFLLVYSFDFGHVERPNGVRLSTIGFDVRRWVFTMLAISQCFFSVLAFASHWIQWFRLLQHRGERLTRRWLRMVQVSPPRNWFKRVGVRVKSAFLRSSCCGGRIQPKYVYYHMLDARWVVHFVSIIISFLGVVISPYLYVLHIISFVPEMPVLITILKVLRNRYVCGGMCLNCTAICVEPNVQCTPENTVSGSWQQLSSRGS